MTRSPSALLAPMASRGVNLSLDAMRAALRHAGDPHLAIPAVHVAGTNGKGSVAVMVHDALRESGIRVGRYTSPHLHRVAERVVIDGEPASDDELCDEVERALGEIERGEVPPLSLFECLTLVAWRVFARRGVAVAVMEVGVGGGLDATNLCAPYVTAITRIAMDHTAWLGGSIARIAAAKAGVCKPGVPCVLGPALREGEAREVIAAVARAAGAPLVDAAAPSLDASGEARWPYLGGEVAAALSLQGAHQRENASVAVSIVESLRPRGVRVEPAALSAALSGARWPGRMERVGDVLFDAAHNVDGLVALRQALEGQPVGAVVFGASSDKDLRAMAALAASLVEPSRRVATAAAMARAARAEEVATALGGVAIEGCAAALARARALCAPGELTVVCGSIFVVAEARAALLGLEAEPPMPM
ncbi:MAG: bifunctional folylpolyglutamate synthase/dihydrofolate synthase [Polyangiales bacterium]